MDFLGPIKIVTNSSGLITLNETLLVQLLSFLIFLFIINRIMFRPLRRTMEKREEYKYDIKKDIEHADAELSQVAMMIKEGQDAVKKEAQRMKDALENAGKQQASEQIEASRVEIAKLKEAADRRITTQIEEARKEIQVEFEELSVSIMEKILNRRLAS